MKKLKYTYLSLKVGGVSRTGKFCCYALLHKDVTFAWLLSRTLMLIFTRSGCEFYIMEGRVWEVIVLLS